MYIRFVKPGIDRIIAFTGLIILSPLLLLLTVVTYLRQGSPVLFCQMRPGLYGKPIVVYKFRTMTNDRDFHGNLLPDIQRLTKVGLFLRSTSLDELPELINVLTGDMSLVGPRPLLMKYLDYYTPEQMRRHEVRPGITGWAQINGRNAITWEDKFALDVWYVEHCSLGLDLKIMLVTFWKVLKREGINQVGQATMPEFKGQENSADD